MFFGPYDLRRVLAGRRALRSHVRRVVDCERLEDCRRECATEKRFHCESFNYRLDTTFQGKGLCELMTKPIEAFDIRNDFVDDKDYDFFELDRNSLEPNCPETLRGPGLLHSGYLSSKGGISDRIDWNGYRDHNRYDEKRHYNQKRRYENYVPYQIGYGRVNDNENWGQYGGNYGGNSYYKDRSDFHKSYNHWRLSDSDRHVKIIKDFNYHNLGRHESQYGYGNSFKHSGYASGYDDSGRNRKYSDHEVLGRHDSRDDFVDLGKHFEYSDHESNGRHDSQFEYEDSRKHGEISSGLDSLGTHREYGTGYGSSGADHQSTYGNWRKWSGESHSKWDEATFEGRSEDSVQFVGHFMPGQCWIAKQLVLAKESSNVSPTVTVKAALTVTGLGACEAECIRAHSFFCRGFSFRFESAIIGDDIENCILTSSPPTSLENGRGLRPSGGHELYARGNYGRGCEPAIYDDVQHRDALRGRARVKDDKACGKSCNEAPFKCLSFSFNNKAPPHIENCLLSEIRLFDLQRGVDYEHSADDLLYAFDLFNGQCWKKAYGKFEVPTLEVPRPLSASSEEHYIEEPPSAPGPYIASGPSGSIYSGHEPPEYFENGPSSKPDKPYIDTNYRPIPYKPIPGPVSMSTSWRQYTVSGFPCRRGTTCEQNRVAGHWACEPEGGEIEAVRPRPDRPVSRPQSDRFVPGSYLPEADRRYWPIAYLHKDSPPNSTYFRFNETSNNNESENTPDLKNIHSDRSNNDIESRSIEENHRNQKHINVTQIEEDDYELPQDKSTTLQPESPTTSISTTSKLETTTVDHTTEKAVQQKTSQLESPSDNYEEDYDIIKGIDGKLNDFTTSIEVFNLDDAKTADKNSDVKTLEAEERQIEAIGRLLAAKRGGKLISKTNLSTKNIAVDKDFMDFNFNNRFPTERRGTVKRISKEELKKEISNDKSLEVSETTYVRPPRVLTTTENIRKAIVNGKVFYDATIRDQRELFLNSTRKAKSLRIQERSINSSSKKNILQRNVNPVRRVKRVYKKRYNPDEVRKRLLEREKNKTI
ncbi:unnamed protein product [Leptidea sinapis]|uniref:Apple domain-containing protein n=1 Tax=Leptidea sinapis TaxID=189913 RepID=A0A5E4Q198_9NEOP|nr:unnamed protein product [Leptidea sinapis]